VIEIESDFLEFISGNDHASQLVKSHYLATKKRFNFVSRQYKKWIFKQVIPHRQYDQTAEGLIDMYKFTERWWLYRYLAYPYWKKRRQPYRIVAQSIIDNSTQPIIVDYGCGLGFISFEIGHQNQCSEIFLVDVDTLILKFASFRFAKHGIKANSIQVSKENLYPELPKHNVCIAWEIFEHLKEPLKAFDNIISSLEPGGLLCGWFRDHEEDATHVTPDSGPIREQINQHFTQITKFLYQRRNENEIH